VTHNRVACRSLRKFRLPPDAIPRFSLLGFALLSSFCPCFAQRRPGSVEPPSVSWKQSPQPPSAGYVGNDQCESCHRPELLEFGKTAHSRLRDSAGKVVMTCETCHGPGKAHSDGEQAARGNDAKTIAAAKLIFGFHGTPKENAERCLTCHITGHDQAHFNESQHLAVGVSCNSCHSPHLVETVENPDQVHTQFAQAKFFSVPQLAEEHRWLGESLLKRSQPALCYSCHSTVQAQFALPFHHRVPEGLIKCTDCHNPHGTNNLVSLRKTNWETCASCHVEKRGPFVFEHPPVRVLGCVQCHNPHGAVARFMLVRREARFLCLQCHGDPHSAQASVPHGRLGFQTRGDCTRCHVTIHGSNFNVDFLQ